MMIQVKKANHLEDYKVHIKHFFGGKDRFSVKLNDKFTWKLLDNIETKW